MISVQLTTNDPGRSPMKTQDPSALRASLIQRMIASLLDFGLFSGLAVALISGMNFLIYKVLGSSGASFNGTLISFPLMMLYFLYFSSELMMGKTLGKQLLGVELRAENGMNPTSEALFKRFIFKHVWAFLIFVGYVTNVELFTWIGYASVGVITLGGLGALGKSKQAMHDRISKLAVFPSKAPKADLSTLSKGKSESQLVEESRELAKKLGTSESVKKTAKATLTKRDFPCAVELNVYVRYSEHIEEEIFNCFAQYVPNIHPNQIQLSDKKKGSYRNCKVVMQFETPLQMETSYNALAKLPNVITTITVRSVKVGEGKGKRNKTKKIDEALKAQASLG